MTSQYINGLNIRPIEDSDKSKIIALWYVSGLFAYDSLDAENEFTVASLLPQSQIFVAEDKGEIQAVVLAAISHNSGWVWDLAVHPCIQNKGVGKFMVRHAENWIKSQGGERSMLFLQYQTEELQRFYLNQSYRPVTENIMHKML